MAVESPHVTLLREMNDQGNKYVYGNEMKYEYGLDHIESGMLPMYVSPGFIDTTPAADSGLTYSVPVCRKRSRDTSSFDPSILSFQNNQFVNQNELINQKGTFTFLDQDISMQIYQQQLEIDHFISNHMDKVRLEIEATRRRNSMRLIASVEEGMKKKLRSKEDEILKIGKLNYALEEKVKSLNVENQLWQQMAETNEATANVLRRNLQQILTQNQQQEFQNEDVESCCGSNYDNDKRHKLAENGLVNMVPKKGNEIDGYCTTIRDNNNGSRWCRNCGKRELCVLLLPCRHLCICTVCESSINFCPVCKSAKNASLHVNMT